MNYKILATVSALAIMSFTPAMAESKLGVKADISAETATDLKRMKADPDQVLTKDEAKRGWENTKETVKEAADDIEYTLFGKEKSGVVTKISSSATAKGLLNQPVRNATSERVGTMRDIIINADGKAELAVVSDAEKLNIGKEAAFDYSMVMRQNADGDIIMPLTEEGISKARRFSYDMKDAGKDVNVRTIPAGGYSIHKLLAANVVDPQGKKVASVDNITFRNGKADALIVGFGKVMGMGGRQAALSFSDVKMMAQKDGDAEFQLTTSQAAQFETFKQNASN